MSCSAISTFSNPDQQNQRDVLSGTKPESESRNSVTELLLAWQDGNEDALERLMPLVYQQLKRLAGGHLRSERKGHPLQPTALVNEAYLRLIDQKRVQWKSRAHFFGIASLA